MLQNDRAAETLILLQSTLSPAGQEGEEMTLAAPFKPSYKGRERFKNKDVIFFRNDSSTASTKETNQGTDSFCCIYPYSLTFTIKASLHFYFLKVQPDRQCI